MIECTSCYKLLAINHFSNTQIKKGNKRCVSCVENIDTCQLKCSSCKNLADENQFSSTQLRKGLRRRCLVCVERDRWSKSSYDERKPYKCFGCRCWWTVGDYSGNQLKKGKKRRCLECVSSTKLLICLSCGDSYSKEESSDDKVCRFCQSSESLDSDPEVEDFYLSCSSCDKMYLMSEVNEVSCEPNKRECNDCLKSKPAPAIGYRISEGLYRNINRISLPMAGIETENQVSKYFKSNIFGDEYFDSIFLKLKKANEIIGVWNNCYITKEVRINHAEIWHNEKAGFITLVEPYLTDFVKFNSNTGWSNETKEWQKVMQSLSHFSYHVSKGKYLLCDLQGSIYEDEIVLSEPSISSHKKCFGPTDLSFKGMETFFANHKCSKYCESDWIKPKINQIHFFTTEHTTMTLRN